MKKQYGLIGYPLSHSFSRKYFSDKFQREGIVDCSYDLFEIATIDLVENLFRKKNLRGFNVTIPYKHDITDYLDDLDQSARKVGAVNVVKIDTDGKRTGFNSDYYGFRTSLENWLPDLTNLKAQILGSGGAAKAVIAVLSDLSIPSIIISRNKSKGDYTYEEIRFNARLRGEYRLIINTTPLGMSPNTEAMPDIEYQALNGQFYLYDLIYNPPLTRFLEEGKKYGTQIKNGLEMLELQAEKSWEIWNS